MNIPEGPSPDALEAIADKAVAEAERAIAEAEKAIALAAKIEASRCSLNLAAADYLLRLIQPR